jgi:hypothetical protein
MVPIPKFFEWSRKIPVVPLTKKNKLMVEGEVNDATSDEGSDNEQL